MEDGAVGGERTRGENRKRKSPCILSPALNRCPFFSLGPREEESGRLGEAGHPHPTPSLPLAFSALFHLPFASPPPLPRQTSSSFLFAEAPEGDP